MTTGVGVRPTSSVGNDAEGGLGAEIGGRSNAEGMYSGDEPGIVFAVAMNDAQGIAMPRGRSRRERGAELNQITAAGQRGVKREGAAMRRDEDGWAALYRACGVRDVEMLV